MLSFLKLSFFVATVAALDMCERIEDLQPCSMPEVLEVSVGTCGARVSVSDASKSPSVTYKAAEVRGCTSNVNLGYTQAKVPALLVVVVIIISGSRPRPTWPC